MSESYTFHQRKGQLKNFYSLVFMFSFLRQRGFVQSEHPPLAARHLYSFLGSRYLSHHSSFNIQRCFPGFLGTALWCEGTLVMLQFCHSPRKCPIIPFLLVLFDHKLPARSESRFPINRSLRTAYPPRW